MKIEINEELKLLVGEKSVYIKDNCFHIGELNYFTIMKILKVINKDLYDELLLNQELSRCGIQSILYENKDLTPNEIITYINSLKSTDIEFIGKEYQTYLNEFLKKNNFQIQKFKALLYSDANLDTSFVFREFPNLKVIFLYDIEKEELQIINRQGFIFKKKKISESSLIIEFDNFKEAQIKEGTKKYINSLIRQMVDKLFNLQEFFADMKEEIFNRILALFNMVDLEEETLKKLEEYEKENSLPEKLSKALSKKLKERDQKFEKKYGKLVR